MFFFFAKKSGSTPTRKPAAQLPSLKNRKSLVPIACYHQQTARDNSITLFSISSQFPKRTARDNYEVGASCTKSNRAKMRKVAQRSTKTRRQILKLWIERTMWRDLVALEMWQKIWSMRDSSHQSKIGTPLMLHCIPTNICRVRQTTFAVSASVKKYDSLSEARHKTWLHCRVDG